jgi:type I restriction enzyme M protein
MSEELHRRYKAKKPKAGEPIFKGDKFGNWEHFVLGETSFSDLKKAQIISECLQTISRKRPDGLIVDRSEKESIKVKVILEWKKPTAFVTEEEKRKAIVQCKEYCEGVNCKIGVITDGKTFFWINGLSKNEKPEQWAIVKGDGYDLHDEFERSEPSDKFVNLLEDIENSLSPENNKLNLDPVVNPYNLAKSTHQKIWMLRKASPTEALLTFIEFFMFKYLSDLSILTEDSSGVKVSFDHLLSTVPKRNALNYYMKHIRPSIKEMFPASESDGTTIINGMHLNPNNHEDNTTFLEICEDFKKFGTLKNIDPEFKSRLFEEFLKYEMGKSSLGQFFTPRNIIKAIVEMGNVQSLPDGAFLGDPAAGVAGFLLEPLLGKRKSDFYVEGNKIKSKINYRGFDVVGERGERVTTILAKANFLIALSDLLSKHPHLSKEIARHFNEVFKCYTDTNLGSLSEVAVGSYDLILSNPPYVTNGSRSIKDIIAADSTISEHYQHNGIGLEGLFLDKICMEVKEGGRALIVLPDGIFFRDGDKNLRDYILSEFIVEAIVSLPKKAFYETPKKTYILSIKKKEKNKKYPEKYNFFAYFVKDIGEELNKNRFKIEQNDLLPMVKEFKIFQALQGLNQKFSSTDKKLRIWSSSQLSGKDWAIDRWVTDKEKQEMGFEIEEEKTISLETMKTELSQIQSAIGDSLLKLENVKKELSGIVSKEVTLDDIIDFSIKSNRSFFTKKFINQNPGAIPVYGASQSQDEVSYGYVKDKLDGVNYFHDCLTWNIDGSMGYAHYRSGRFSLSEKVIPLVIKEVYQSQISPLYLKLALESAAQSQNFDYSGNKAGSGKIKDLKINIPVKSKDKKTFDLDEQKRMVEVYQVQLQIKEELNKQFQDLKDKRISF